MSSVDFPGFFIQCMTSKYPSFTEGIRYPVRYYICRLGDPKSGFCVVNNRGVIVPAAVLLKRRGHFAAIDLTEIGHNG